MELFSRRSLTTLLGVTCLGLPALTAAMASPTGNRAPVIISETRKEIRIAVSVRPSMRVRQMPAAGPANSYGNDLLFCVWSNSSSGRYDVGIILEGSEMPGDRRAFLSRLQWGGNEPVVGTDGLLWIRDQLASRDDPACATKQSVLAAMATSSGTGSEMPAGNLITVLISPQ